MNSKHSLIIRLIQFGLLFLSGFATLAGLYGFKYNEQLTLSSLFQDFTSKTWSIYFLVALLTIVMWIALEAIFSRKAIKNFKPIIFLMYLVFVGISISFAYVYWWSIFNADNAIQKDFTSPLKELNHSTAKIKAQLFLLSESAGELKKISQMQLTKEKDKGNSCDNIKSKSGAKGPISTERKEISKQLNIIDADLNNFLGKARNLNNHLLKKMEEGIAKNTTKHSQDIKLIKTESSLNEKVINFNVLLKQKKKTLVNSLSLLQQVVGSETTKIKLKGKIHCSDKLIYTAINPVITTIKELKTLNTISLKNTTQKQNYKYILGALWNQTLGKIFTHKMQTGLNVDYGSLFISIIIDFLIFIISFYLSLSRPHFDSDNEMHTWLSGNFPSGSKNQKTFINIFEKYTLSSADGKNYISIPTHLFETTQKYSKKMHPNDFAQAVSPLIKEGIIKRINKKNNNRIIESSLEQLHVNDWSDKFTDNQPEIYEIIGLDTLNSIYKYCKTGNTSGDTGYKSQNSSFVDPPYYG